MGKKRRLISAKAKFSAKHSNHPRMVLINKKVEPPVKVEDLKSILEVEKIIEVKEKNKEEPKTEIKATTTPTVAKPTKRKSSNKSTTPTKPALKKPKSSKKTSKKQTV